MGKVIGIDLGTTNSVVAVFEGGEAKTIINQQGHNITPSIVAFSDDGNIVGQIAKNQSITDPTNVIFSIKRLIGRRYFDNQVQSIISSLPFHVSNDELGKIFVETDYGTFSPQEVSAEILRFIKKAAENYLGEIVSEAVITIPAYFDENQREATKEAGELAGLNVKRIINEPTAAALAYGLKSNKREHVIVYDFGGGTFDISVLEIFDDFYEVKSTSGDTFLGGDDFNERIAKWLLDDFRREYGIDLTLIPEALRRIKLESEEAKKTLSTTYEYNINLPFINCDSSGNIPHTIDSGDAAQKVLHINKRLTRKKLEEMTEDLIDRTIGPCQQALNDAGLEIRDIDTVILVGGQTRMPLVQEKVKNFFGKEPSQCVNPDEIVAVGAAIQASVLKNEIRNVTIADITALSLGIETEGGQYTKIIEKNTKIPWVSEKEFTTIVDNQEVVEISVYQGEALEVKDNIKLGNFILEGITLAPAGVPRINVEYCLDENGILTVSARDVDTGVEKKVTISNRVV